MREKRRFAERTRISKEDRTIKKYFLVFEGNRTEGIYFNAINELKDKIGINPLIEIISIERTYTEEGWSNPKKILEQLLKDLEEIENGKFSYKTLVDKIIEIIMEDEKFFSKISKETSSKEIIEDIKNEIESLDSIVENIEEDCEFFLNMIIKKFFLTIEEKSYPIIKVGIGMSTAQELVVKAGRKNVSINSKVWIGDAVTKASNLSSLGNKDGVLPIVFSELSYINFIEKLVENTSNDDPKSWFKKYSTNEYGIYYSVNIIKNGFYNWIKNGMN